MQYDQQPGFAPTSPPTLPSTLPSPGHSSYPSAPPYVPTISSPPMPSSPPGRSDVGNIVRIAGVVLAILIIISIAAASLPASIARARAAAYPMPSVAITMPQSSGPVVLGASMSFVAQVRAGNDLSFSWDFGDDSSAVGATVNHTYTDYGNGVYTVTLTATDPIGQQASSQLPVNVTPAAPTAGFTTSVPDQTNPLNIQFDASSSTGTQLTCSWDFGDGSTDPGVDCESPVTNQYQQTGTFTVMLTVQDIAGQSATDSQQVTVSIPKPVASFTTSVSGYCVSVDASASTGYQLTYNWDFGDGSTDSTSSSDDYDCNYSSGTYTITLTVTDAGGQSSRTSQTVSI